MSNFDFWITIEYEEKWSHISFSVLTIYTCIAEDFETVKQIDYKNCLKSWELYQCKNRQFYTMILKRTHPPLLSFPDLHKQIERQAVGHMKSNLLLYTPSISTIKSGTVSL